MDIEQIFNDLRTIYETIETRKSNLITFHISEPDKLCPLIFAFLNINYEWMIFEQKEDKIGDELSELVGDGFPVQSITIKIIGHK
jgi:hypothetical protein